MPAYSRTSARHLDTCHQYIQEVFRLAIREYDHTVLEGRRGRERQNEAFRTGRSKVQWPNSKHNVADEDGNEATGPSLAVDVVPYPVSWANDRKNLARFYHFAGYIKAIADVVIPDDEWELRWGGDWDGDLDFSDQTFDDLAHWEMCRRRTAP